MTTFIISGLVCTGMLGSFAAMVVYNNMESGKALRAVVAILVAFVVGFGFVGALELEAAGKAERWNGGFCPTCNKHWTPNGVTKSRHGSITEYYYCENCFEEIQL